MSDDVVTQGDRAVTEPANRALGYGDDAVNQGVLLAQAPPKTPRKKRAPACAVRPKLLTEAKRMLLRVRPNASQMANVKIKLMKDYPIKAIRDFQDFAAWTNMSTQLFLRCQDYSRAQLRFVMYHESLHFDQFAANNDQIPTYTQMIRFECEAYLDTADWLADARFNKQTTEIKQLAQQSRNAGNLLRRHIEAVEKATADLGVREQEYEKFMKDPKENMLPAHKTLTDLYHRP